MSQLTICWNGRRPAPYHPIPGSMWTEGLSTAEWQQKKKKKKKKKKKQPLWARSATIIGGEGALEETKKGLCLAVRRRRSNREPSRRYQSCTVFLLIVICMRHHAREDTEGKREEGQGGILFHAIPHLKSVGHIPPGSPWPVMPSRKL